VLQAVVGQLLVEQLCDRGRVVLCDRDTQLPSPFVVRHQ